MDLTVMTGVAALFVCVAALVLLGGGYVVRDHRRHFRILRTARAHGLEPVGMILGGPDMVIGVALADPNAREDRFAHSTLCAVVDGNVLPLDSEVVWRAKRARRLVWYGLLRSTGRIGRDNFMGFIRWDSARRHVPVPSHGDLVAERSILLERVLPIGVILTVAAWLFLYVLPRL